MAKRLLKMPTSTVLSGISLRVANAQDLKLSESDRRRELLEARSLLEADFSFDEKRNLLYTELRKNRYRADGSYIYRYIRAVYDAYFIYEQCDEDGNDCLFQCSYTIGEDASVTLSAPVLVREETKYVPLLTEVTESGNAVVREQTISLREGATLIGKDGRSLVKIISPGKGSSGNYSREIIERDIPIIFPAGTQMMSNHASQAEIDNRPEGEWEKLVGQFLEDPIYLEESSAPDGEGSYAWAEFFDDWKPMVKAKGHAVGVSINAEGEFVINEAGEVDITRLVAGRSVDVVTRAGRGGKIVSLREAATQLHTNPKIETTPTQEAENPAPAPIQPTDTKEGKSMTPEEKEKMAALEAENAQLKAKDAAREAATKALESLNLPKGARARIIESQASKPVLKESGELDTEKFETQVKTAAEDEIRYAKENYGYGGGDVAGLGDGDTNPETIKARESDGADAIRTTLGL